jgi:hypothetical protein
MIWAALHRKIRTLGMGYPLLVRAIAIASLHLTAFIAICTVSYARLPIGSTVAAAVLALLALTSPLSGMLLVLIAVNFQYLFWFDPGALYEIGGLVSVAYILRALPITLHAARQGSWLWFILAAFIGLVLLHLLPLAETDRPIQAVGFLILTATLFLHCRHIAGTLDAAVAVATMCIGGFAACILSFAYLYVPFPELFLSHSPLYDLHLNDLRLSGVQDSNAIAKLALPGILALMLLTITRSRPIALWILLLVAGSIVLAAAASKSVMLALVPVMLALLVFAIKRRLLIGWTIVAIAMGGSVLLFSVAALPSLKYHAAVFWEKYSEPKIRAAFYGKLAEESYLNRLRSELRIPRAGQVHCRDTGPGGCFPETRGSLSANDVGRRPASDGIAATGQRVLIFKTGLAIVYDHLWWGIGYKHWAGAMEKISGIPFLSPHNGLLEVWGSYGLLGAIVYLALIAVTVRIYVMIKKRVSDPTMLWFNLAVALFLLALLVHEIFEVATVLAVTPYALWAWAALGLQDGILRSADGES